MNQVLYKYRSLENFEFLVDIIVNNRLYASSYKDLNDPMEGQYHYDKNLIDDSTRKELLKKKKTIGICSLSKNNNEILMWSHYANSHKGVCIGVEIAEYSLNEIKYEGLASLRKILKKQPNSTLESYAKEILRYKFPFWKYEEEIRVFTDVKDFINVKVIEIILGKKIEPRREELIKKLVKKCNPLIEIKHARDIYWNGVQYD